MYLALLWHFHQPIYRNPDNGVYMLPWVNFHTVKNYSQMASLIRELEFPCTINFAPCLLEQIEEYAQCRASDPYQEAFESDAEKPTPSQVKLLRRFVPEELNWKELQIRVLQSFFSPLVKTKADRDYLINLQKEIWRGIIPGYRKLENEGLIEITTSPYYHPLLPLIFDIRAASEEAPHSLSFQHPEDVEVHLEKGREYFRDIFGKYPSGLWPSEGAISQEVAQSIAGKGFSFAVTDESVLWKSLDRPGERKQLYQPFQCGDLPLFFRDRELSDLLSFTYQKWDAENAAADFLRRLKERKKDCGKSGICVVALDGENPWAGYPRNGVDFLRTLFSRLKQESGITLTFFSDYLALHKPSRDISIVPGTWMGNFSKWVGSPAKNRAWETLSRAREQCGAPEEILIAESSDWFWWYGEKEESDFDSLFRSYVRRAYRKSGLEYQE